MARCGGKRRFPCDDGGQGSVTQFARSGNSDVPGLGAAGQFCMEGSYGFTVESSVGSSC